MAESKVDRLPTGIAGLDSMLYGGVPTLNQVLIAGGPGSGKTLMCFEILYRTAKSGVPSVFVTLEETPSEIIKSAKAAFPDIPDIDQLIADKKLIIIASEMPLEFSADSQSDRIGAFAKVNAMIEEAIKTSGAKVVAIDSVSVLKMVPTKEGTLSYRRAILGLMGNLRRLNVTAFITYELSSPERGSIKFSTEFFIFDGIIVLYQSESEEKRSYNMEIVKMRMSNHSLSFAPYEITSKGFRVFATDQMQMY